MPDGVDHGLRQQRAAVAVVAVGGAAGNGKPAFRRVGNLVTVGAEARATVGAVGDEQRGDIESDAPNYARARRPSAREFWSP